MTDKEMWSAFCRQSNIQGADYDSWAFGDDADKLASLVLEGSKSATASVYDLYAYDNEELPEVGSYSVILDSEDNAVCVIRDTEVRVVPFHEVDADHARLEGEGDLSLSYWRDVHKRCFTDWMNEAGMPFDENTKIVLEKFEVVFRP